ncbi:MAG: hypothetical protein IKR76_11395 [Ruminococcus sp.]|nr:hypothetical protein [Ruminococcus sp.]
MKKKLLLPLMAIVLALSFLMTACGDEDKDDDDEEDSTPKYEIPIEAYFKTMETGSAKEAKKCFCQTEIKKNEDQNGDDYYDKLAESLNKMAEDKFGENVRITYKIKDKDKLDDDDLENYSDRLQSRCDDDDIEVTEGYKIKVKAKIKGDDDEEEETETFYVGKVDGKWVVLDA